MRVAYYMTQGESDLAPAIRQTAIAAGFSFRSCNGTGLFAADRDSDIDLAIADEAVAAGVKEIYAARDGVKVVPVAVIETKGDPAKVIDNLAKLLASMHPPIALPVREAPPLSPAPEPEAKAEAPKGKGK